MKALLKTGIILGVVALGFSSCLKPKEYDVVPVIEYKSFTPSGDTAFLSITFTDGDGDVGLAEYETQPPYDTSSKFYYNLFINYYEKVNGVWVQGTNALGEPVQFNYRVPYLTPEGNNKALKGEIQVKLSPRYYNVASPDSDTIKFDIQLADRALQLSNIVETPEIVR